MKQPCITIEDFQKIIRMICGCDTSADPKHWSAKNPLWGHCAVVALLAQKQFGGVLVRQSLEGISGLEYVRSHYSNILTDGMEIDFTLEQFRERLAEDLPKEERTRERVLSHPDTRKRYKLLKGRFKAKVEDWCENKTKLC